MRSMSSVVVAPGALAWQPRKMCHRPALKQVCRAADPNADSSKDSSNEPAPRWAQEILAVVKECRNESRTTREILCDVRKEFGDVRKEFGDVRKEFGDVRKESRTTREMLGVVLEAAVRDHYHSLGVNGSGGILQSVGDVLQLVLPCNVLFKAAQDAELFSAVKANITASLLDKDTGFLKAVIVLLEGEGMKKEAEQVEAVLCSGEGIKVEQARIVRECLEAVQSHAKAKGLGDDIRQLFTYNNARSTQERVELLQDTLFVRCVAATLLGTYRGVLEIDAGFGVGCQVDEGAQALRLRVGETKYSAGEMGAADKQLKAVFQVAAFTLDKVLEAAAVAPAASEGGAALKQLPTKLIMDGICIYAGAASNQQRQQWEKAVDRRTEADFLGGGLESAMLQVQFMSARYTDL